MQREGTSLDLDAGNDLENLQNPGRRRRDRTANRRRLQRFRRLRASVRAARFLLGAARRFHSLFRRKRGAPRYDGGDALDETGRFRYLPDQLLRNERVAPDRRQQRRVGLLALGLRRPRKLPRLDLLDVRAGRSQPAFAAGKLPVPLGHVRGLRTRRPPLRRLRMRPVGPSDDANAVPPDTGLAPLYFHRRAAPRRDVRVVVFARLARSERQSYEPNPPYYAV